MSRLLTINNIAVDIDEKTAIGITLQSYDLKSPGNRKVSVSNSFTVPATSHNLQIFGYANDPQSTSTLIYDNAVCNYWVENNQLITDSRCRVESISDRIGLFIFQKPDVWDELKLLKWPDFVADFLTWMHTEKNLPSQSAPFIGNISEMLEDYINPADGVILPMYYGNLYNYTTDEGFTYLEDSNNIYLKYYLSGGDKGDGGHFCVFAKTVFEYIEYKYGVNFLTQGGIVNGNLWDDEFASAIYTPFRDITVRAHYDEGVVIGYYFEKVEEAMFLPLKKQKDKADKSLYDFVNAFFQHFNVIKDEIYVNNQPAIKLSRFDDLKNLAEVVDFSGRLTGVPIFKPSISGYKQENTIKFKQIFPEGDSLLNSKVITCENKNLDPNANLFDIDAYVCSFLPIAGGVIPDLSIKESFKTFQFLINSGLTNDIININFVEDGHSVSATYQMQKAALYSLSNEYNFLDEIITYPRFVEVEKWLTYEDVKDIEFFKQYFIRELGGSFFINKISGFNPEKSNKATKLELIKVSSKTPITPPDLDYWMDGVTDPWTDGIGDIFF